MHILSGNKLYDAFVHALHTQVDLSRCRCVGISVQGGASCVVNVDTLNPSRRQNADGDMWSSEIVQIYQPESEERRRTSETRMAYQLKLRLSLISMHVYGPNFWSGLYDVLGGITSSKDTLDGSLGCRFFVVKA